jgi:aminopeptidase N
MTIADDSKIRKQDASSALRSVCRNRIGRDVAWDWIRSDYDRIRTYFGPNVGIGGPIEDMVVTIASDFNTKFGLDELEEFYNQHIDDFGANNRDINKAVQKVKANINWMDNNYETIVDWLKNRIPNEPTTTTTIASKGSRFSFSTIITLSTCAGVIFMVCLHGWF